MNSLLRQVLVLGLIGAVTWGGYTAYRTYVATPDASDRAASGGGGGGRGRGGPVSVEVATVAEQTLAETFEAVGTTRARQSVEVVALASGRVVEIGFEPGTRVKAGTVLARLDDDIEKANLLEATAKLDEASRAAERGNALRRNKTVTEATMSSLESAKAVASAELDRAKRRLADREIVAPFAGTVGLRQVDVGARVDTDTVLTTLDDLGEAIIEFSAPEGLFGRLTPKTEITARTAAAPDREFRGRVTVVDSRIDPVARAFKIRAVVPNDDAALPAGMFMLLEVTLGEQTALVVPEEAVTVEGTDTYVFLLNGEKVTRRSVTLGRRRPGLVAITSGLVAGDRIVTRGVQKLRDGAEVSVVGDAGKTPTANVPASASSDTQNGAASGETKPVGGPTPKPGREPTGTPQAGDGKREGGQG